MGTITHPARFEFPDEPQCPNVSPHFRYRQTCRQSLRKHQMLWVQGI